MHICKYVYNLICSAYIYMYIYICIYIYIYVYICIYVYIYICIYACVCVPKKSINLFWGVCFSATHSFADEIWVFVNNNQNWTGVPWHGFSGYIDVYRIYLPYF